MKSVKTFTALRQALDPNNTLDNDLTPDAIRDISDNLLRLFRFKKLEIAAEAAIEFASLLYDKYKTSSYDNPGEPLVSKSRLLAGIMTSILHFTDADISQEEGIFRKAAEINVLGLIHGYSFTKGCEVEEAKLVKRAEAMLKLYPKSPYSMVHLWSCVATTEGMSSEVFKKLVEFDDMMHISAPLELMAYTDSDEGVRRNIAKFIAVCTDDKIQTLGPKMQLLYQSFSRYRFVITVEDVLGVIGNWYDESKSEGKALYEVMKAKRKGQEAVSKELLCEALKDCDLEYSPEAAQYIFNLFHQYGTNKVDFKIICSAAVRYLWQDEGYVVSAYPEIETMLHALYHKEGISPIAEWFNISPLWLSKIEGLEVPEDPYENPLEILCDLEKVLGKERFVPFVRILPKVDEVMFERFKVIKNKVEKVRSVFNSNSFRVGEFNNYIKAPADAYCKHLWLRTLEEHKKPSYATSSINEEGFDADSLIDDAVTDVVSKVLLPQVASKLMDDSASIYFLGDAVDVKDLDIDHLKLVLALEFMSKVLGDKGLNGLITFDNNWHRRQASIHKELTIKGEWLPLLPKQVTPASEIAQDLPQGWKVICLTNGSQLVTEGRVQHHCVGGYTMQCLTSPTHILSIRDAQNRPITTVEVDIVPQDELGHRSYVMSPVSIDNSEQYLCIWQHYGPCNDDPKHRHYNDPDCVEKRKLRPQADKVLVALLDAIEKKKITIDLQAQEEARSKNGYHSVSAALKGYIGYEYEKPEECERVFKLYKPLLPNRLAKGLTREVFLRKSGLGAFLKQVVQTEEEYALQQGGNRTHQHIQENQLALDGLGIR